MKNLLITGSRDWTDEETLCIALLWAWDELRTDEQLDVNLISGACPTGADHQGELFWKRENFGPLELHPAQWGTHTSECPPSHAGAEVCRMAGFRRNAEMVARKPDLCLAFIKRGSNGATMTRNLAEKNGIPTITYYDNGSVL